MHILDLARMQKENQMNAPTPDEKAQIVIAMQGLPNLIFRYKSVKAAEKQLKAINEALKKFYKGGDNSPHFIEVKSDVIDGVIMLGQVAAVSFANLDKFMKFTPHTLER